MKSISTILFFLSLTLLLVAQDGIEQNKVNVIAKYKNAECEMLKSALFSNEKAILFKTETDSIIKLKRKRYQEIKQYGFATISKSNGTITNFKNKQLLKNDNENFYKVLDTKDNQRKILTYSNNKKEQVIQAFKYNVAFNEAEINFTKEIETEAFSYSDSNAAVQFLTSKNGEFHALVLTPNIQDAKYPPTGNHHLSRRNAPAEILTFDDDFKLLWKKIIPFNSMPAYPYYNTFGILNNGLVYYIEDAVKKEQPTNKEMATYFLNETILGYDIKLINETGISHQVSIKSPETVFLEVDLSLHNERLIAQGYYVDNFTRYFGVSGLFNKSYSITEKKATDIAVIPLAPEIVEKMLTSGHQKRFDKNPRKESPFSNAFQFYHPKDGNSSISILTQSCHNSAHPESGGTGNHDYLGTLVTKMDKSGNVLWQRTIARFQSEELSNTMTATGYKFVGDKIYLFFNDVENNFGLENVKEARRVATAAHFKTYGAGLCTRMTVIDKVGVVTEANIFDSGKKQMATEEFYYCPINNSLTLLYGSYYKKTTLIGELRLD